MECQCDKCKDGCRYTPGWFIPGEVEKAAEYIGVETKEFFDKYIGVNWWEQREGDIFVLAPAIKSMLPGEEYPDDPRGECIFYENGLCKIHEVKPFECSEFIHDEKMSILDARHQVVAKEWKEHQSQIKQLLGHHPRSSPFYGSLFGIW